eukprot:TRINITY_DN6376_c0_g2_i2.p2 TRINITY_DN6376_c0_g2~~TRINITY_DN6376_c0_g2_i2.p2  ORF type:complete len:301 (+),score=114.13 TRINITY_DN6376_c0_g2_i2:48-905(+)
MSNNNEKKRSIEPNDSPNDPSKKIKMNPTNNGEGTSTPTSTKLNIQELMKKKELLAQKREALLQKNKVMEDIKKTSEKKRIVSNNKDQVDELTAEIRPPPLILDDEGKPLIDIRNLKKNVTKFMKKPTKKTLVSEKLNIQALKGSKTFDPRVNVPSFERKKRTLNFLTPGALTKKSQQSKDKIQAQLFEKEMEDGFDVLVKPEYIALMGKKQVLDEVPSVEWWDSFLFTDNYDGWEKKVETHDFGILLEHPKILKGLAKEGEFVPLPLALTKKERKKIRRQKKSC